MKIDRGENIYEDEKDFLELSLVVLKKSQAKINEMIEHIEKELK